MENNTEPSLPQQEDVAPTPLEVVPVAAPPEQPPRPHNSALLSLLPRTDRSLTESPSIAAYNAMLRSMGVERPASVQSDATRLPPPPVPQTGGLRARSISPLTIPEAAPADCLPSAATVLSRGGRGADYGMSPPARKAAKGGGSKAAAGNDMVPVITPAEKELDDMLLAAEGAKEGDNKFCYICNIARYSRDPADQEMCAFVAACHADTNIQRAVDNIYNRYEDHIRQPRARLLEKFGGKRKMPPASSSSSSSSSSSVVAAAAAAAGDDGCSSEAEESNYDEEASEANSGAESGIESDEVPREMPPWTRYSILQHLRGKCDVSPQTMEANIFQAVSAANEHMRHYQLFRANPEDVARARRENRPLLPSELIVDIKTYDKLLGTLEKLKRMEAASAHAGGVAAVGGGGAISSADKNRKKTPSATGAVPTAAPATTPTGIFAQFNRWGTGGSGAPPPAAARATEPDKTAPTSLAR